MGDGMDVVRDIERIEAQLPIASIDEAFDDGGVHYQVGCYRAPSGHYVISCSCGWRRDTGKTASSAYALHRAHVAGHRARVAHDFD